MTGEVALQVHLTFMRQGLWGSLLGHMTKCLGYSYSSLVLQVVHLIVRNDVDWKALLPMYTGIHPYQLSLTFYEVLVLIVVSPRLEMR